MTQNGDEGKGYVYARLEDHCVGRSPLVSQPRVDEHHEGQEVTASIHSAAPARVPAPAATADIAAPVPLPGHLGVAGSRVLPYPSFARRGKVGGRLAQCARTQSLCYLQQSTISFVPVKYIDMSSDIRSI